MSPPLVSICVPTYNGGQYLAECLESIQAQSWRDFEVLILDDCSTDNTKAIALDFASMDERFKVISNVANLGLVGNWNRCVELASGAWIKFVFQDDALAPDGVERLLAATKSDTALVACSREFTFEDETPEELRSWYFANRHLIERAWGHSRSVSPSEFREATLAKPGANWVGEPTSVLFRREVFERFGQFNPDLIMSCDLEYWTRLAVNLGFEWVADRLAIFRIHEAATSATNRASRAYRMNVLDDLIIMHEFAFDPIYAPLRAAGKARTPPIDLSAMFNTKAAWAENVACHPGRSAPGDQNTALREWNSVAKKYPRMRPPRPSAIRGLFNAISAFRRSLTRG